MRRKKLEIAASMSLLALVVSGCYYRQLRCVLCRHHTSVDTMRDAAGRLKSTARHTTIGAGLHGNHRNLLVKKEFDTTSKLTTQTREAFISTYRDFGKIMLWYEATEYRWPTDSMSKRVETYKKGKLSRVTVVNK